MNYTRSKLPSDFREKDIKLLHDFICNLDELIELRIIKKFSEEIFTHRKLYENSIEPPEWIRSIINHKNKNIYKNIEQVNKIISELFYIIVDALAIFDISTLGVEDFTISKYNHKMADLLQMYIEKYNEFICF